MINSTKRKFHSMYTTVNLNTTANIKRGSLFGATHNTDMHSFVWNLKYCPILNFICYYGNDAAYIHVYWSLSGKCGMNLAFQMEWSQTSWVNHDDDIKWNYFPRYWSFVSGIHRSPHKGQWRGALIFSLICLNHLLSKQWRRRWFETLSSSLWRHCNSTW